MKPKSLIGVRTGICTIIADDLGPKATRKITYRCDCGTIRTVLRRSSMKRESCGCLRNKIVRKKHLTHGLSRHPIFKKIYHAYKDILKRCNNENHQHYQYYGERGIFVCDEWQSDVTAFFNWSLENCWESGLEIDRIDNDGPYSPGNCRWATKSENKLNTRLLKINNSTGYRGVSAQNGKTIKYLASITFLGEIHRLGTYETPEEAARARDIFCIENNIHTPLNFSELDNGANGQI